MSDNISRQAAMAYPLSLEHYYYQYNVGKHFIGTAHYHRGKWYWYSSVTEDLLAEYGKCDSEEFDEAIEAVAWMPLPELYKGGADMRGVDDESTL